MSIWERYDGTARIVFVFFANVCTSLKYKVYKICCAFDLPYNITMLHTCEVEHFSNAICCVWSFLNFISTDEIGQI